MELNLIDNACNTAFLAAKDPKKGSAQATQINQLLEVFQAQDIGKAIDEILLHILYQTARTHIDHKTSKALVKFIDDVRGNEKIKDKEKYKIIHSYLVYVKKLHKVFSTIDTLRQDTNNKNFETLIKSFKKLNIQ